MRRMETISSFHAAAAVRAGHAAGFVQNRNMLESDDAIEVLRVFISPGHNFFGRHGREPSAYPTVEVENVECLAGRGLHGDRFLDYKADYAGQITFFASEVFAELCAALGVHDRPPAVLRRNVLTRGADLNALVGREFTVKGVRFAGMTECKPCHWMDAAFAPGAEEWLRGRGGLRARILTDGVLRAQQMAAVPN